MNRLLVLLIRLYQKTISPDHGVFSSLHPYGYCRHYPSCSEYARQAIEKHGAIYGLRLAAKRLISCNPFVDPKIDPVPAILK